MKKIALAGAISLVTVAALAGEKLEFDRSLNLSADRLSAVEFDVGAGSLDIIGTDDNEINVEATIVSKDFNSLDDLMAAFDSKMDFRLERESEYAMLYAKSNKSMNWGKSKNIAINLTVTVPRGFDVVVDDSSGSISIERIDGTVKIDDGSGSIKVSDIGNDLWIDDGSGSISINNVQGDVDIDDGSGSVEMKNITGSVKVEDGSGGITAKVIGGDFTVDDGSGDVVVKELVGDFRLIDDGSGSIRVNGEKWGKR
ncbi:hypothetical protein [Marinicella meishanensis]|uniref:hypothetical protein n=1 Tax=Marinicella meishanensis TaxID=2873263 RepID=UPI001CC09808|nr:hypothetical protein [Marinicella sp. NBU2979]